MRNILHTIPLKSDPSRTASISCGYDGSVFGYFVYYSDSSTPRFFEKTNERVYQIALLYLADMVNKAIPV